MNGKRLAVFTIMLVIALGLLACNGAAEMDENAVEITIIDVNE